MVQRCAHRYQVLLLLVVGLFLIIIPTPVSGSLNPVLMGDIFHQASAWGCVGMSVGGAPGVVTVVADKQTSGNLLIKANSFTANSDGTVWYAANSYPVTESGSSQAVNFQYSGLQAALVNGVIYVFTQNSPTLLDLNSGIITGGAQSGTMNWATAKSVQYSIPGEGMSMFKALPYSGGIYLVSQQKNNGVSVLDISLISGEQLGASSGTIIPTEVCQVENSSGFLVPDSQIYSALITTWPGTNDTIIVGTSDSGGQVYSWYINPDNPQERGETLLFSTSDLKAYFDSHLSSVALFQGSSPGDPTGIHDLVVVGFEYDNTDYYPPKTTGSTFCADLTKIGTPGYAWINENININDEMGQYYATPGICTMYSTLPIASSNGKLRTNMLLFDMLQTTNILGQQVSILTGGSLESDILVPDPGPAGNFDTLTSFDTYGNLALPVGFIDGIPPIALNGHDLDPADVDSKVILVQTDTQETDSSGSTESSVSAGFNGESDNGMNGVGASWEQTVKQTTTASTGFSTTMTDTFGLDAEGGNDYAYMIYLAPQFMTQRFYDYDINGNPPASGDAKTIYITYPDPDTPYKYFFQGYSITTPPDTGWLAGALKSPSYNNFDDWNWTTMTGGWHNRDWSQSTQNNNLFTVYKFEQDIEFQNGGSQTTTYDMTDSLSHSYDVETKISTDAKIFGFGGSNEITYDQESGVTNSIQKGLEFYWCMAMPDNGGSGYQTVVIEPQIINPIVGAGAVPWAPGTYAPYQPWLITYNLVEADMTPGTPPALRVQQLATGVDPLLSGTITMTPASPKKGDVVTFRADPTPGYVFSHWKAWGVDLDDVSSSTVTGQVITDISTVRAYFEQSESGRITAADFVIPPEPAAASVAITGKIPDGLTWAVAMGVQYPLDVTAGSADFLFGPMVGNRTVLSPYEILFTTKNKKNETSQLRLNFNTKTWTFSSPQTRNLGDSILGTHVVRLGLSGKGFRAAEELPLAGTEVVSWTGGDPPITNDLFSFDKNTIISSNLTFQGVNQGRSTFQIRGAGLTNGTVDPSVPVTLTINQVKVLFDNATKSDNSVYTYTKSQGDLFTVLILDSKSKTWQVDMNGKRLTHSTWPEDIPVGLQIGAAAARVTVHPDITANLHKKKAEPIQADFTAVPKTGTSPLSVQFSDLSSGDPTTWRWAFGDGSSSGSEDPGHIYTSGGTYDVTLTVGSVAGSSTVKKSNFISVNQSPGPFLANFTVSPTNGMAPMTVECTDKSIGNPTTLVYNFGDGTNVTGPNPTHTYRFPGVYTISLSIMKYDTTTNSLIGSTATKPNVITVNKVPVVPLVAKFAASPVNGTAPLKVSFTDQSTGSPTFLNYDFGDGINATGPNPIHTYRFQGAYTVTLSIFRFDSNSGSMLGNTSVQRNCIAVKGT